MSTIKPIYLLADSQLLFWREEKGPFLERIWAALDEEEPGKLLRAAYVGASNGDAPEFYDLFKAAMGEMGIQVTRMIPSEPSAEDLEFFAQADLILLAGGETRRGWEVFQKNGLQQKLVERYYAGALLMGVSAGAVQLGGPVAVDHRPCLIELLAGIPSVVYGFWGLVVLVPLIGRIQPPGTSLLAGIAILTIMILPTIALMADASLAKVPPEYLRGAAALGLSRWATIRSIVFPAAKSGLFTGVILETGRAIGETMAILMVCGNVVQTPKSLFDPIRTLTANIALEMAYATGDHRSALFVSGLVLMALIVALVVGAEVISKGRIYE